LPRPASSRARPLRIAFFGLPIAALLLDADGHAIVYAGVCRRDAPGTRRLIRTLGRDRVSLVPRLTDARVRGAILATSPDLLVSWFWTRRIPEEILGAPPLGSVGVHPSLLPRHRGPDPYFWTILEGDREAGVSAHRLEREYDTGAVLAQSAIAVDPTWTAWRLAKKLDRPSLALLREVVTSFAEGRPPAERAQDPHGATQAPAPTEEELRLDVRSPPAAALERRACDLAPRSNHRLDGGDADHDRIANDVVHPVALQYRLHQRDGDARFGRRAARRADQHRDAGLARRLHDAVERLAAAIEHDDAIA
jgi:methionyl-tRNA formyltransferase